MYPLLRLWLPIAFNTISLTGEVPLLLIGMSRGALAHETIAAFGLAFNFLLVASNPIQALSTIPPIFLDAKKSFRALLSLTIVTSSLFSLLLLCWWFIMPYCLTTLGLESTIVQLIEANFLYLVPIPLLVGLRRYCEGVLVHLAITSPLFVSSIIRILITLGLTITLITYTPWPSMTIGCGSMLLGLSIQTALIGLVVRKYIKQLPNEGKEINYKKVWQFYSPLVLQSFLQLLYLPILSMTIAGKNGNIDELAAWTVLYNVIEFLQSGTADLDTLTPAALRMKNGRQYLWRLCMGVNIIAGCAMLILWSPIGQYFFEILNHLGTRATEMARISSLCAILTVYMMGIRGYLQGILIKAQKTKYIQHGAVLNIVVLCTVLIVTMYSKVLPTIYLSILALTAGTLAETLFLRKKLIYIESPSLK